MIVGVGLDVVSIERWSRALAKIEADVFTPAELAACAGRADRVDALAARFAAKEACLKALKAGVAEGTLRQVEILSSPSTAPTIQLSGALDARARTAGVRHAHVSLSHQEGVAAAIVILEGTTTC